MSFPILLKLNQQQAKFHGHKRSFPLAVVLPPPARGPGTLIPSAQRLVWAATQLAGRRLRTQVQRMVSW